MMNDLYTMQKKDDEDLPHKVTLLCNRLIPTTEPSSITLEIIGNSN